MLHPLRRICALICLSLLATIGRAEIRRDPVGVNVNSQSATTVFISFAGLQGQIPIEAFWCGELISAAPDLGLRCDPTTLFGQLPIRYDQSRLGADGFTFTDIMSIPPSVARRAYQAAALGADPSFFYVRRFRSFSGGPDEYVFVTCRLTAGGARSPLALLGVELRFEGSPIVLAVARGKQPPRIEAAITYDGTGRLRGRWEVAQPADLPPDAEDLLSEASLPVEERSRQTRFTELARFNVFLPPTGQFVLEGPDPALVPTATDGLHLILLRIEASDDREADSNLAAIGAGPGVVHSGGAAGFPLPALRYYVGGVGGAKLFQAISPVDGAIIGSDQSPAYRWQQHPDSLLYRIEFADSNGVHLFSALLQAGIGAYRAPPWLPERTPDRRLRWRVVALGRKARELAATAWREVLRPPASTQR